MTNEAPDRDYLELGSLKYQVFIRSSEAGKINEYTVVADYYEWREDQLVFVSRVPESHPIAATGSKSIRVWSFQKHNVESVKFIGLVELKMPSGWKKI